MLSYCGRWNENKHAHACCWSWTATIHLPHKSSSFLDMRVLGKWLLQLAVQVSIEVLVKKACTPMQTTRYQHHVLADLKPSSLGCHIWWCSLLACVLSGWQRLWRSTFTAQMWSILVASCNCSCDQHSPCAEFKKLHSSVSYLRRNLRLYVASACCWAAYNFVNWELSGALNLDSSNKMVRDNDGYTSG